MAFQLNIAWLLGLYAVNRIIDMKMGPVSCEERPIVAVPFAHNRGTGAIGDYPLPHTSLQSSVVVQSCNSLLD
jgi:hypothetical protein